jgi:hypothetical protein
MQITEEQKFIKRIGWVTNYNWKRLKQLEGWQRLFDLSQYPIRERFEILKQLPGVIENQQIFENLTPTAGFRQLTKAMTGNIAALADIIVNVHAMGTSSTAPANGNTQLIAETVRKALTSKAYSDNKAFYTIFYTASEAVGTFAEIGLFINGDPLVANSGVIWDRSLLPIVKSNTQTLTIDYEDTFING